MKRIALSKMDITQFIRGAVYSIPLNILMLIFFIGMVIVTENSTIPFFGISTPGGFAFLGRLVLFIPPITLSIIMVILRRKERNKVFFWIGTLILQTLLLFIIHPNFDM